MIRVILPFHLRTLAHAEAEVTLAVASPVTQRSVLDAWVSRRCSALSRAARRAIRDHDSLERRPFLRAFVN